MISLPLFPCPRGGTPDPRRVAGSAAPTQGAMPPPEMAAATSVAAMPPPPPPALAAVAGRRRPRPQSTLGIGLGIAHHQHPHTSTASALASPSTLTNCNAPRANTGNPNETKAVVPRRMFLRDAIILAEQNSCGPPNSNATNAATAGGATEHGTKAPRIHDATDAMYVRLMGRVVQIHSCDDAAGGNDDDDVSSFVIDDGTATVHVVVGQLLVHQQHQQHHLQVGLPSAAKRPRLQTGTIVSELGVELGVLVDCVGYLSLAAAEIDAPVQEAANAEEDQNGDCADVDGNDEKIDAGQSKEQREQDHEDIINATDSSEPKQDATADANEPRKEQPYCASPTNDGEEPAQKRVPQDEECGECEESSHRSGGQQARPIFDAILSAVTVATVSHPDSESLRTLELILAASSTNSSSDQANNTNTSGDIGGNANDAIQGIHMASGLVSKIGAFQHRSQEYQWHSSPAGNSAVDQQQSQVTSGGAYSVCSNTAFRLIRSTAADGGISEEDLAIALGCICGSGSNKRKSIIRRRSGGTSGRPSEVGNNAEVMAVRRVLQELQAGGEIYKTRRGTYLPL